MLFGEGAKVGPLEEGGDGGGVRGGEGVEAAAGGAAGLLGGAFVVVDFGDGTAEAEAVGVAGADDHVPKVGAAVVFQEAHLAHCGGEWRG